MNQTRAELEFSPEHPALRGHFPGDPIVPGVLLLDEVLHSVETMPALAARASGPGWQIGHAKFHRLVRPGERLALELDAGAEGRVRFELRSGRTLVAQGVLLHTGADGPMRGRSL